MPWKKVPDNVRCGVVISDYVPSSPHCLRDANFGEVVEIIEENGEWYRGRLNKRGAETGIFPKNHVIAKKCRIAKDASGGEVIELDEDPVATEITGVVLEWGTILVRLFKDREIEKFKRMREVMMELIKTRRQILADTLPHDHLVDLKARATERIDVGNRALGLDLIPRNALGEVISGTDTTVMEMYRMHLEQAPKNVARGGGTVTVGGAWAHRATDDGAVRADDAAGKPSHLVLHHQSFGCSVGEETDIYYTVYDAEKQSFISEGFVVRLSRNGLPQDIVKMSDMRCAFTEIATAAPAQLYVVAYVNRIGQMDPGRALQLDMGSKKTAAPAYLRRPVGCGVTPLGEFLERAEEDTEQSFNMILYKSTDEDNFSQLHRYIIDKAQTRYAPYDRQKGIIFTCRLLTGHLPQVMKKNPLLFKKGTEQARRLGFPEVIMPGDSRNDLYVTICQAQFDKGEKKAGRNIEVDLKVVHKDGRILKNCISPAVGMERPDHFTTLIYRHNNRPKWFETVKLEIPPQLYDKVHLKFVFKHCSSNHAKKDQHFCFAFQPLVADPSDPSSATLADGDHNLKVYKYSPRVDADTGGKMPFYLGPKNGLQPSSTEMVLIKTLSCSTSRTQEPMLVNLIKWELKSSQLEDILHKVTFVKGTEVVKFLNKTLDALFAILETHKEKYGIRVFDALVHMCSELSSTKFNNFRPQLEQYTQRHLKSRNAYLFLLKYVHEYMAKISREKTHEASQRVRKTMKALQYIFTFAYRSRRLYNVKNQIKDKKDETFKTELSTVFKAVNDFMADPDEALFPTQELCIRHFSAVFPGLAYFFTGAEISNFATSFLNSVQASGKPKLMEAKLRYLRSIVQGKLFASKDGRSHLLPAMLDTLRDQIVVPDQTPKVLLILGDIMTKLQQGGSADSSQDVLTIAQYLLSPLLVLAQCEVAKEEENRSGTEGETEKFRRKATTPDTLPDATLFAALLGLLRLMTKSHYQQFVKLLPDAELTDLLLNVYTVFTSIIANDIFPKDWMVMDMLKNDVILDTTVALANIMSTTFVGDMFHLELWSQFFTLASTYVCQRALQVQNFSETKRRKILEDRDDRRVLMANVMSAMWKRIDHEHQMKFIHTEVHEDEQGAATAAPPPGSGTAASGRKPRVKLIRCLQEAALVPDTKLREALIPMFYDFIECEVESTEREFPGMPERINFDVIEKELINELDTCVSAGAGDNEYQWMFDNMMSKLCRESSNELIREKGAKMVESVKKLLQQLLALRNVPEGKVFNDMRAGCMKNLLYYYRSNGQKSMALRYVHRLYELHKQSQHYTEAGFALALHYDELEWTDSILPPFKDEDSFGRKIERFPEQTERERKEQVGKSVIEAFDKGDTWENAIRYAKELATQYETETFEFAKLSAIHQQIARMFDRIVSNERKLPQYFKVGYYGASFPLGYRNVTYVYRGNKQDHIKMFCDRIQNQFPKATLLMKNTDPTPAMKSSPDQSIMICKLNPVADPAMLAARFKGKAVPDFAKTFHDNNEISTFTYSRPFRKGDKTGNEFETLWTANYTLKTAEPVPCLLNRALIPEKQIKMVEMSPIDNAITSMKDKNTELQAVIMEKSTSPALSINPLTMALNGVLDAAVMGGTDMYRKAFFTNKYLDANEGDEPKLDALQSLMQKQIEILEMGCMVHARYCPPDLKPLQARLEEQLEKMKKQAKTGTGLERRSSTSSSQSLKVDESGTAGSPVPGGTTPHGQKLPPRGASVRNSAANPKNPFGPKVEKRPKAKTTSMLSDSRHSLVGGAQRVASLPNPKNPFPDDGDESDDESEEETLHVAAAPLPPRPSHSKPSKNPFPESPAKHNPFPESPKKNPFPAAAPETAPPVAPKVAPSTAPKKNGIGKVNPFAPSLSPGGGGAVTIEEIEDASPTTTAPPPLVKRVSTGSLGVAAAPPRPTSSKPKSTNPFAKS